MVSFKELEKRVRRYKEIMALCSAGISQKDIGNMLNLSQTRVCAIIKAGEPKERVYVGRKKTDKLTNTLRKMGGRERTREMVRHRDNYTCQTCKKKWNEGERRFDVHHLNGLCGKRSRKYDRVSEIDNLITLCHKCHFNHPEHSNKLGKLSTK